MQAYSSFGEQPLISYKREAEDHAVFFDTVDSESYKRNQFEERIDDKYIDPSSTTTNSYRTEYFSAPLNYQSDPILLGFTNKIRSCATNMFVYFCL